VGPFASRSQLNHTKICKNLRYAVPVDHSSPVVHGSLFRLVSFAQTQPHASYSAFTHGFSSKWTFFLYTTPEIAEFFLPLEQVIHHHFLPSLVSHSPNDVERSLFVLPAHMEGLGIFNPCAIAAETYTSFLGM